MAQYLSLANMCRQNEQVRSSVNEFASRCQFPYRLRCIFAQWIESQNWLNINWTSEEGKKKAERLYKELSSKITAAVKQLVQNQFDLHQIMEMETCLKNLEQRFEGKYDTFVEAVSHCLQHEKLLMESACRSEEDSDLRRKNPKSVRQGHSLEIRQSSEQLQREIALAESHLRSTADQQNEFVVQYNQLHEKIKILEQLINQASDADRSEFLESKVQAENKVRKLISQNVNCRSAIADTIINLAAKLEQQLTLIYTEIEKWNISQKRTIAALSQPQETELELIEKLYDDGGKLLCSMVRLVEHAITVFAEIAYDTDEKFDLLKARLKELKSKCLVSHLQSAFVIDRQPVRVLKVSSGKSLGFSMSVRILGGVGLGLSSEPYPCSVKVALYHERDLNSELIENAEEVCQICDHNERPFSVNRGTNVYSALFNSVALKFGRRPDRGRSVELVTEQKYAFVFTTKVHCLEEDVQLQAVSLPIILTSQTSQELMANGTLIWDAAFSEQERIPFQYKETVRWGDVAQVLNNLFFQNTGRYLTKEHLDYLACMVFRSKKKIDDVDNKLITEKQVIREKLPRLDFSFWKWFWSCINLVKNHIREEWNSGLIYGFISKEGAKRLLMDKPCGTFLLRFSEKNIENSQKADISGCLTLAVMENDPNSGQKKLFHVKEYLSPKDLRDRKLCQILDAMEVDDSKNPGYKKRLLQYVYPDTTTTFEDRFGQFLRNPDRTGDPDYVPYCGGKYKIEIFLTNSQAQRNRLNSVDGENASCSSTPYANQVFSPQSLPSIASSEMPPVTSDQDLRDIFNGGLSVDDKDQISTRPPAAIPTQLQLIHSPADGSDLEDLSNLSIFPPDVLPSDLFDSLPEIDAEMQLALDADNDIIITPANVS